MELTYNGLALHDLGEITISQETDYEGGENPVRTKRTIKVRIDMFEDTFAANHAHVLTAKQQLKVQHGTLHWADTDTGTVYVDQPAIVVSEDFPEDPNGWGRYHQALQIVFQFWEQDLTNQSANVRLTAGAVNIDLPQMIEWKETVTHERFSPLHSERKRTGISVAVSGLHFGNTKLSVTARRSALHAIKDQWRTVMAGAKEMRLVMGTFDQVVRIESFEADVNQAVNALAWSFTANYTGFPDEANYSTAEYKVTERNGSDQPAAGTGEQFLVIAGSITANSEATALTRINEIRNALLTSRGYTGGQIVRHEIEGSHAIANTDGSVFLERSFTLEFRRWRVDNQAMTFQKTGAAAAVNLGQVTFYAGGYNARRFSDQRSQRSQAGGRVEARGTLWLGDWDLAVVDRRALLTARITAMEEAVNGADGRLIYGSHFDKTVRIDEFRAEMNQGLDGVEWSLNAVYSHFPNEAGYATVEFSLEEGDSIDSGDKTLSFSGRILAQSEAAARAKLTSTRTAVLAERGFADKHLLDPRSTVQKVYANGDQTAALFASGDEPSDGTTFIELNFSETYRKRMASITSTAWRQTDTEEDRSGFITTVIGGSVVASGATADAAYAAALAKAQEIGADKYDFRVRASIAWDKRQTRAENDVEFVRLEFSYEYQRKGTRSYIEVNSSTSTATYGSDAEHVTGSVVAVDAVAAQALYAARIRSLYAGTLKLEEEVTTGKQDMQNGGGAFVSQFVRLEFRLSVFKRRTTGRQAIRYAIDTAKDWLNLTQTTTVSGTCFAATKEEAEAWVNGFLGTLQLGASKHSRRNEVRQQMNEEAVLNELVGLDFEEVLESNLTGVDGILECEVTEEIEFSGVRWQEQPLPRNPDGTGGISIIQDTGITPGRRTVRVMVKAATTAICRAWADDQRALLTGDANNNHFELPSQRSFGFTFAPRVEGIAAGVGANFRVAVLTGTFAEILPNYPYAA